MSIKNSYETLLNTEQAPHIIYDKDELKPDVVELKKWDFIYKLLAFLLLVFIFLISLIINSIWEVSKDIAYEKLSIKDLEPIDNKLKEVTNSINMNNITINQFLLESLFFVWDKNYEIINKLKLFFEDSRTMANLWDFQVSEILLLQSEKDLSWKEGIEKIPVKIKWKYNTYRDIESVVNMMNKMKPVVITKDLAVSAQSTLELTWYVYRLDKKFLNYTYWESYKIVNELLRLKEEYDKNLQLLNKLLEDKDLWLNNFGIEKIYNCSQYEQILTKQWIEKPEQIELCKNLEKLVKKQEVDIDSKFNIMISTAR